MATPALATDEAKLIARMRGMAMSSALDRLYVDSLIALHNELLPLHKAYGDDGHDPIARAVAMVAVPSIGTHLAMLGRLKRNKFV